MSGGISDQLVRGMLRDTNVRVLAAFTTQLSQEAANRHCVTGAPALALSRAATSTVLLATLTKGNERVTMQVMGDGPLGAVVADGTSAGTVRCYLRGVQKRALPISSSPPRLANAVGGAGTIEVLRDLGLKDMYKGQCALVSGEIDADIEYYLNHSEQVPSALGCDARLAGDGSIVRAGGFLIQAMPGSENPPVIRSFQQSLREAAVFAALQEAENARELLGLLLGPLHADLAVLDESPLFFHCQCSEDKVRAMLHVLSVAELDDMLANDKCAEVGCDFCRAIYRIDEPTLRMIRDQRKQRPGAEA